MRPVVALALLIVCGVVSTPSAVQDASPADWTKAHAIPLKTPVAGSGFEDMRPLERLVGGARIVSLGEATHGTREFFQLKHRMLEFLASEMGFTIFSIEANMPEAYQLNDYVLNGTGDPAELLRGMFFWTWDTEEVLAMIKWMRAFNASGRGRVQFTGFDMQTPTVAGRIVNDFVAKYDADFAESVQLATKAINVAPQPTASGSAFALAAGSFPVAAAAGKRIRFSGYIKTDAVADGYAGLWWRVNGPDGKVLAFDNLQARGPRGTSDWTRYEIDLPVAAEATNITFGLLMPGRGTAWFDDLAIDIDGQPYANPIYDFGFESGSLRGLSTNGAGYEFSVVTPVARTGTHSLRITGAPLASTPAVSSGPPATAVVTSWTDVVSRLEAGQAKYRTSGAADAQIAWAIQNARVALQCAEMRAGQASRDHSMAVNVKWILDQDPKAKIVLWAHNGHVASGGFDYETMGAALRKMYGQQMVIFGFAFSEGSFQAIPQAGGRLMTFTVPPAPAGSLDATLAAAGVPLFALDLRQAPPWFREPHGTRMIGAVYPEGQPFAFMMDLRAPSAYDAMLFVQKTTAAVKNPGR